MGPPSLGLLAYKLRKGRGGHWERNGFRTKSKEHLREGLRKKKKKCKGIKARPSHNPKSQGGSSRSEEPGSILDSAGKSLVTLERAVSVEPWGQHQIAVD